ncbi:MAG: hypothetical protein HYY16_13275 [Planctomycetes bacterium]|nr:hypothetical protein [Planctomycetota bacterium]
MIDAKVTYWKPPAYMRLSRLLLLLAGVVLVQWAPLGWSTWVALGCLVLYLVLGGIITFRVPEPTAAGILQWVPKEPLTTPEEGLKQLQRAPALEDGERVFAAVNKSRLEKGKPAYVLTDRRILRINRGQLEWGLPLEKISRVFIRHLWYPRVPYVGRGAFLGKGPVVVVRLRIQSKNGQMSRIRWSESAGDLYPFLNRLVELLGPRIEVGRVLPGI